MTKIDQLRFQATRATGDIQSVMESLKISQKIYQENSTIYPPKLDDMVNEALRDCSCIIRRWALFVARLDGLKKKKASDADISDQIIKDFQDIRLLYIQGLAKIDDVIFEFQSIDDLDKSAFEDGDLF